MGVTGRITAGPGVSGEVTKEVGTLSTSPDDRPPGAGDTLATVTGMVRAALSDYGEWTGAIAPNARLDGDLGMQSVELAALQDRLSRRWGAAGDLDPLLRTLDLAGLTGLTVADVAAWVAGTGPAAR